MGLIRQNFSDDIHFVTNRTEHEMFFLLPRKEVNELIRFWMAKAVSKYARNIEIFAFCFLSNHFHVLCRDPGGELAIFMSYFQGNLAKAVNKLIGRKGTFWSREYDDVIVDGEDAFWNRYAYTTLNPVSSGLVDRGTQWSGVCSLLYVLNHQPFVGVGINQTKYGDATRFGKEAHKKDFEETYEFELAAPPMLADKTQEEQTAFLKELLKAATKEYHAKRKGKPALGMQTILQQNYFDSPSTPKKRARFKFMSFCEERLKALHDSYKTFITLYRQCVHILNCRVEGLDRGQGYVSIQNYIYWPDGSYPPTRHRPMGIMPGLPIYRNA
jgi:REP element-mobilizing transposase RayT